MLVGLQKICPKKSIPYNWNKKCNSVNPLLFSSLMRRQAIRISKNSDIRGVHLNRLEITQNEHSDISVFICYIENTGLGTARSTWVFKNWKLQSWRRLLFLNKVDCWLCVWELRYINQSNMCKMFKNWVLVK